MELAETIFGVLLVFIYKFVILTSSKNDVVLILHSHWAHSQDASVQG